MKIISTACLLMLVSFFVLADDKSTVELNEFVVNSLPKESAFTTQLATTNYTIGMQQVEKLGVQSIKNLSAHIPNYYLPDYGSKITSSMYIRGIGSRMNEPAIGMYVDNVPYIHRSAFADNTCAPASYRLSPRGIPRTQRGKIRPQCAHRLS